jgi:primase-polymerase (primpol)-like protein
VWKYGLDEAGKITKHPYTPYATKRKAKSNDPKTWNTFDKALAAADGFNGLGFVLTATDPWTVIDLDHCRNKVTGAIKPWAWEIILSLNSYTEISPSGEGIHIWIRGRVVDTKRKKGNVEIFFAGFYLTMTGRHLKGTPATIEGRQIELEALHREIFGEPQEQAHESPRSTTPLELTDLEIIAKAKSAQNGNKFDRLMAGVITGYPSSSEADMALCSMLAFWTQARLTAYSGQAGFTETLDEIRSGTGARRGVPTEP